MVTRKIGLKKITSGTLEDQLTRFLFQYRLTPYSTTVILAGALVTNECLPQCLNLALKFSNLLRNLKQVSNYTRKSCNLTLKVSISTNKHLYILTVNSTSYVRTYICNRAH